MLWYGCSDCYFLNVTKMSCCVEVKTNNILVGKVGALNSSGITVYVACTRSLLPPCG